MQDKSQFDIAGGYSIFSDMRRSKIAYVDKSLFIKEFIDSTDRYVDLLAIPSRFGKTLMMTMLRDFFAINRDEPDNPQLFNDLDIAAHPDCIEQQRKYPVLHISFSAYKKDDFKDFYGRFQTDLSEIYKEQKKTLWSSLTERDQKFYQAVIDKSADKLETKIALHVMTTFLHEYYKQKVIVLIDDYDYPFLSKAPMITDFMRDALNRLFKDQDCFIQKGLLMGSTLTVEGIPDCVSVFGPHAYPYNTSFGFLREEVSMFLEQFSSTQLLDALADKYGGYQIGAYKVYHPANITSFLSDMLRCFKYNTIVLNTDTLLKMLQNKEPKLGCRWTLSDLLDSVSDEIKEDFKQLLSGRKITIEITRQPRYESALQSRDNFWHFLLAAGYVTFTNISGSYFVPKYELAFPNLEHQLLFKKEIEHRWDQRNEISVMKL